MSTSLGSLSTSLLDDLWSNALDPSYAQVTRSRLQRTRVAPIGRLRRSGRSLLAAALVGAAVALAVTQVRMNAHDLQTARAALLTQIGRQEQVAAGLGSTTDRLRGSVDSARSRELATSADGARVGRQVTQLQLATAGVAVSGPGVTVRLVDPPQPASAAARVSDADLQSVVNALWAAGAEAVAVNGQRLGPGSAIRTAGDAVLVDFRPISSPYAVEAVGNQNALQTGYASSDAAAALSARAQLIGLTVNVTPSRALHLPAVTTAGPILATPIPAGAP